MVEARTLTSQKHTVVSTVKTQSTDLHDTLFPAQGMDLSSTESLSVSQHSFAPRLSCRGSSRHLEGLSQSNRWLSLATQISAKIPTHYDHHQIFKQTQISVPVRYNMSVPSSTRENERTAPCHGEITPQELTIKCPYLKSNEKWSAYLFFPATACISALLITCSVLSFEKNEKAILCAAEARDATHSSHRLDYSTH